MRCRGFTLIELVMVIVLIGILAAFVAPNLGNITSTNAGAFSDKLRADIRYAQNLAMTRNARARVYFNGTGAAPAVGYAVAQDNSAVGDCSSFVVAADPAGGGNLTVTLNTGDYANITVASSTNCLEYDSLGRPYDCIANLAICSATSAGVTVTINPTGSVAITAQTGAVN
jgi:prepilin-type N-terminal cleavage/methylation domain-containing protein